MKIMFFALICFTALSFAQDDSVNGFECSFKDSNGLSYSALTAGERDYGIGHVSLQSSNKTFHCEDNHGSVDGWPFAIPYTAVAFCQDHRVDLSVGHKLKDSHSVIGEVYESEATISEDQFNKITTLKGHCKAI